jgi:hypothetical protein
MRGGRWSWCLDHENRQIPARSRLWRARAGQCIVHSRAPSTSSSSTHAKKASAGFQAHHGQAKSRVDVAPARAQAAPRWQQGPTEQQAGRHHNARGHVLGMQVRFVSNCEASPGTGVLVAVCDQVSAKSRQDEKDESISLGRATNHRRASVFSQTCCVCRPETWRPGAQAAAGELGAGPAAGAGAAPQAGLAPGLQRG